MLICLGVFYGSSSFTLNSSSVFDNFGSFWLIGHFEVILCKVCKANITKIIFTIILVHQPIESQILKSNLYLLLLTQTK